MARDKSETGKRIEKMRKWIRQGTDERDSNTRGKRIDRKADVIEMLPAVRAIVNVYQLHDKEPVNKKGGRKETGKSNRVVTSSGRPISLGTSPVPGLEGRELDDEGNLIQLDNESDDDWNTLNKLHRGYTSKTASDQDEQRRAAYREQIKLDKQKEDARIAKQQSYDNSHKLFKILKEAKINPFEDGAKSLKKYKDNTNYSQKMPNEDFEDIKRAIKAAVDDKRMDNPVVAISTATKNPPQWYFIKNDLSYRRRKNIKSNVRRPILKLKNTGNKRKVVMKKKGGKR